MTITWLQAILLGILGACGGSTQASLGTTVGNYTLNRPLIASVFVGLVLGDIEGCIMVAIPMQIIYIALVTPGGTVAADLGAVSFIGIPLAYVAVKNGIIDGLYTGFEDAAVAGICGSLGALVGTVGTVFFYTRAMFNLIWQHWGWAQLDKKNLKVLGLVDAVLPLITHLILTVIPTMFLVYYGQDFIIEFQKNAPMDSWYMKSLFTLGSLLPAVGMAILLRSVVTKPADLIYFVFGFAIAASMHVTLLAATAIGGAFALINYQLIMSKGAAVADDDEEDI